MRLSKLASYTDKIAGKIVHDGAKVVADTTKQEIGGLPTVTPETRKNQKVGKLDGITPQEKLDLSTSFGIASMRDDGGFLNVKTGYDGYGSKPTKKYPQGVPNQMLARSVESGTSFRMKNAFNARAIRKSRPAARKAMADTCEEEIQKIMKG